MTFWWMEPGWKKTLCGDCGINIWDDGGDPDWGYCYDCFTARLNQQEQEDIEKALEDT